MALLKRSDVLVPMVPEEQVPVAELGGDVIVRGLLLSERLQLALEVSSGTSHTKSVPVMLSMCVLDADRQPLMTIDQWEAFGVKYQTVCLDLWNKAQTLSKLDSESQKEVAGN
jgi:hypothetical protein